MFTRQFLGFAFCMSLIFISAYSLKAADQLGMCSDKKGGITPLEEVLDQECRDPEYCDTGNNKEAKCFEHSGSCPQTTPQVPTEGMDIRKIKVGQCVSDETTLGKKCKECPSGTMICYVEYLYQDFDAPDTCSNRCDNPSSAYAEPNVTKCRQ